MIIIIIVIVIIIIIPFHGQNVTSTRLVFFFFFNGTRSGATLCQYDNNIPFWRSRVLTDFRRPKYDGRHTSYNQSSMRRVL